MPERRCEPDTRCHGSPGNHVPCTDRNLYWIFGSTHSVLSESVPEQEQFTDVRRHHELQLLQCLRCQARQPGLDLQNQLHVRESPRLQLRWVLEREHESAESHSESL